MERSPFKRCPVCNSKYPHIDVHPVCNKCLSPDHDEASCMACARFRSKKTIRLRRVARQEALISAPAPVNIFETEEEEDVEDQDVLSGDEADVDSNEDADVELFDRTDCVEQVGDDEEAYGAEDSSEGELCPEDILPKAPVEGSPVGLTQDQSGQSNVPPSGPTTDTYTEQTAPKAKPKAIPSKMAASTEPPSSKSKPKVKSSASKPLKMAEASSAPKTKLAVRATASASTTSEHSGIAKQRVDSTAAPTLGPASTTPSKASKQKSASKPEDRRHDVEAVHVKPRAEAPAHTSTVESTKFGTHSASKPASVPSTDMAKKVSDSLHQIKQKASVVAPKAASKESPSAKPPSTPASIQFTLPPKVAPKVFSTVRTLDKPKAASVELETVTAKVSITPRASSTPLSTGQFIDENTGKLVRYKRALSPTEPMEPYKIPLKKKRVFPAPLLSEPVTPTGPLPSTSSPTHSEVNVGEDYDEDQYAYPTHDEDQDDQQEEWEGAADPSDQQDIADTQPFAAKTSPTEDSAAFNALIERAAKNHDVPMHADPVEVDFLFDTFSSAERTVKTLPMLKGVLRHANDIFKDPARARVINPRIEKKYRPAPGDPAYIKGQLPLDSLVVSNARKRANSQATGDAPPPDKESKVLEASGKRVAAQAANIWRISNTQALLARYDRAHYDTLETLLQHLPDQFKEAAEMLVQEGKLISNAAIKCALDVADTAARAVNTSVMLRRQAWLRISGFKPEVQSTILNQPVNPEHLFGPEVDTTLEKIKKDTETAKSMGALQSQQYRGGTFRRSSTRGVSRGQMSQQTQYNKGSAQTPYTKQTRGGYRGNSAKGRGRGNNNSRASTANKQ